MQLDLFTIATTPARPVAPARPTNGATTVHAIGRCVVKGCKRRKRNTFPGRVETDRYGTRTRWSIPTAHGGVSPFCSWDGETPTLARLALYAADRNVGEYILAMQGAGWVCPDHDRVMRVVTVAGTVNIDKSCNARCMGATGPACDCACGGEQHGARWA